MKRHLFITTLLALLTCSLSILIPKGNTAKAASETLTESQIDALFVEHAVDLGSWDSVNGCFVPGTATEYMCKKNNAGVVIQSGFKPLAVGDNISGKTIYIFNVDGTIGNFTNGVSSANGEYQVFTSVGDYAVFAMGSAPIVQSQLLTGTTVYHKIKTPNEISIIKSVDPYISSGCSLFYTYEKIPEISNVDIESESSTTQSATSTWWSKNWVPIAIGGGCVLLIVAFLIVVKKA